MHRSQLNCPTWALNMATFRDFTIASELPMYVMAVCLAVKIYCMSVNCKHTWSLRLCYCNQNSHSLIFHTNTEIPYRKVRFFMAYDVMGYKKD